jgi:hypothetical protein
MDEHREGIQADKPDCHRGCQSWREAATLSLATVREVRPAL